MNDLSKLEDEEKIKAHKWIVFVDMDGVAADFEGGVGRPFERGSDPKEMFEPGFFRNLKVLPGAREGIAKLVADPRLDVYIGSKPLNPIKAREKGKGGAYSYSEKAEWIVEEFPALAKRICLVCNKGLLNGHFLIDDDPGRWKGVFPGHFVSFDRTKSEESWKNALEEINNVIEDNCRSLSEQYYRK